MVVGQAGSLSTELVRRKALTCAPGLPLRYSGGPGLSANSRSTDPTRIEQKPKANQTQLTYDLIPGSLNCMHVSRDIGSRSKRTLAVHCNHLFNILRSCHSYLRDVSRESMQLKRP